MALLMKPESEVPRAPRQVTRESLWRAVPVRWICGWVFTGLGLVFALMILIFVLFAHSGNIFSDYMIDRDPVITEGKVTSTLILTSSHRGKNYRIDFQFTKDGKRYDDYSYTRQLAWRAGDDVTIIYNRKDPTLARIEGTRASAVPAFLILLPMFLGAIGLPCLRSARGRLGRLKYLLEQGEIVKATVTHVVPLRSVKVNRVYPWRVDFRFGDGARRPQRGSALVWPEKGAGNEPPCRFNDKVLAIYNSLTSHESTLLFEGDFDNKKSQKRAVG